MKYNRFKNKKYFPNITPKLKRILTRCYGKYPSHKVYTRIEFQKAIIVRKFAIDMGWSKVSLQRYCDILIDNCHKQALKENGGE